MIEYFIKKEDVPPGYADALQDHSNDTLNRLGASDNLMKAMQLDGFLVVSDMLNRNAKNNMFEC